MATLKGSYLIFVVILTGYRGAKYMENCYKIKKKRFKLTKWLLFVN